MAGKMSTMTTVVVVRPSVAMLGETAPVGAPGGDTPDVTAGTVTLTVAVSPSGIAIDRVPLPYETAQKRQPVQHGRLWCEVEERTYSGHGLAIHQLGVHKSAIWLDNARAGQIPRGKRNAEATGRTAASLTSFILRVWGGRFKEPETVRVGERQCTGGKESGRERAKKSWLMTVSRRASGVVEISSAKAGLGLPIHHKGRHRAPLGRQRWNLTLNGMRGESSDGARNRRPFPRI